MVETASGFGNKYDFGGLSIGESSGALTSEIVEPTFYGTAAEASGGHEMRARDPAAADLMRGLRLYRRAMVLLGLGLVAALAL